MTWLINVDNGGTTTGFCLVDGGEVRYTKTLATPYDLSRCLFDGLAKVSELAYGRPRLAAASGIPPPRAPTPCWSPTWRWSRAWPPLPPGRRRTRWPRWSVIDGARSAWPPATRR